jgi:hypothetical protein
LKNPPQWDPHTENEENTVILQSHSSDAHDWALLAAPACLLALPSADVERLDGIVECLSGPDAFRAALELLTAGGIASAPSFALVDGDSSVARVVLRGEASVVVTASDPDAAELRFGGAGVATWSERVLEGVRSLRLQLPGTTWTLRLEPAAEAAESAGQAEFVDLSDLAEPAAVTPEAEPAPDEQAPDESAPVTAPVAETTLVPKAEIELPALVSPPVPQEAEPYDFLFGDTIYRTRSGASIRIPNPDPERPGDHDGHTVLAEDLDLAARTSTGILAVPGDEDADDAEASDATIVAPIPGHLAAVRMAPPDPAPAPAPVLQLERADGSRESLARPVLIGRAPSVPAATPTGSAPRLLTIVDDKDISRSHLRVSVEGDAVVVTDLASKNGTVVTLPGHSPRKLRGGEPTVILPGTLIDLGGGVTFTVRED